MLTVQLYHKLTAGFHDCLCITDKFVSSFFGNLKRPKSFLMRKTHKNSRNEQAMKTLLNREAFDLSHKTQTQCRRNSGLVWYGTSELYTETKHGEFGAG